MQRMDEEALQAFLSEPRNAVLACINRDGTPQQSPISMYFDGQFFYFRGDPDARKLRSIRRDPRVSLCVEDAGSPERYVVVRGRAEFMTGDWQDIYWAMGEKYGTDRAALERRQDRERDRVYVRVTLDTILGADFSDEYA